MTTNSEGSLPNRADVAQRLYQLGREAANGGPITEAIELLRASGTVSPHFKTFELLGEHLLSLGQTTEGILYLAAAIGLSRSQYRARFLLAGAQAAHGNLDEALALLDEALALNANYKAATELRQRLVDTHQRG
jgi:tetratricopeptide (TPR) repeat protein